MRKNWIACFFLLVGCFSMLAQTNKETISKKIGLELRSYLHSCQRDGVQAASRGFKGVGSDMRIKVAIYCQSTEKVINALRAEGIESHAIKAGAITTRLTADEIERIAEVEGVKSIEGLRSYNLHNQTARKFSSVNDIHNGTNLETPFTGKNVIIGIIDIGLEFDHPAFRITEDSTRIIAVKDLTNKRTTEIRGSKNILALGDDGTEDTHGTHVAGIAAGGSEMGSSKYYGMAPGAELVMIPTNDLDDADILDGVEYVRQLAEDEGKPYVVNMSFGTHANSHDGLSNLEHTMNQYCDDGGILVASAGNEGDYTMHAFYQFHENADTCMLKLGDIDDPNFFIYITSEDTTKFSIKLYAYNKNTTSFEGLLTTSGKKPHYNKEEEVDNENGKYLLYLTPYLSNIKQIYRNSSNYCIVARIEGKPGQTIHVFKESPEGTANLKKMDYPYVSATVNNKTSICSPASAKNVIAVGAYASLMSWRNLSNQTLSFNRRQNIGTLATFSSVGPLVVSDWVKPDVCAPGFGLISSVNKNYFEDIMLTEKVTVENKDYYYGMMQGTSMASPVVTGIVALWLEANPTLTYKQIQQIIQETSTSDTNTKSVPNDLWGYGKINAYKGLKKALELTDIQTRRNIEKPVTLLKQEDKWQILFNSDETYVQIRLTSLDGKDLQSYVDSNLSAGQEKTISLNGLQPGVYILSIQTTNSKIAKKVLVK